MLTHTYSNTARHISKFPDSFLSQSWVSAQLWSVVLLGKLEEEQHVHEGTLRCHPPGTGMWLCQSTGSLVLVQTTHSSLFTSFVAYGHVLGYEHSPFF